jgi:hypothetical protein
MLRGGQAGLHGARVDASDFIVVVNAEKIAVTGSKMDTKIYYRHSGYPGGIKQRTLREQLDRRPTEVLRKAVKGMLPRTSSLRRSSSSSRSTQGRSTACCPGSEAAGALMTEIAQYLGTGKRKTSIARVILRPGDGKTWINGRTIEEYFPRVLHRKMVMSPLEVAEAASTYDLRVRVHGGGISGQAGAIRHGIAARSSRPIPGFASAEASGFHARRAHCRAQAGRTRRTRRPSSRSGACRRDAASGAIRRLTREVRVCVVLRHGWGSRGSAKT